MQKKSDEDVTNDAKSDKERVKMPHIKQKKNKDAQIEASQESTVDSSDKLCVQKLNEKKNNG